MVEPAELKPDELDRLEDALELLEVADVDDPSPAVRNRLGDFRRILQLSRSALPMVDVPRNVLERVMLEARHAAEVPVLEPPVEAAPAPRPGFWKRLRRFALLPGVALVGASALVLIMFERTPSAPATAGQLESEQVAKTSADGRAIADEQTRTVFVPAAGEAAPARQAPAPADPGAPPEVSAAAESTPTSPPAAVVAPAPIAEPRSTADANGLDRGEDELGKTEKKAEVAEGDAKAADLDEGGPPRWDIIARGDRARQQNDCKSARTEYKLALGDADARVRARAHAGIGLCAAFDGETGAADSAYKAARELDPEISSFIESERPRGGGTGSSNSARAKKSPKKPKAASDTQQQNAEMLDPME